MGRRVRLSHIDLGYTDGMVLHTATSGAVPMLDELRLVVTEGDAVVALGASRMNIAYLSGIEPEVLVAVCLDAVRRVDWTAPWSRLVPALDDALPDLPAPARMLIEIAAADGAARAAGQPLSVWLGGPAAARVATNQTLFRTDDATLLKRADAYAARGFLDLKLRIGFGPFADDLRRLTLLRRRFGPALRLSADANGRWSATEAADHLAALAPLGMDYLEQPSAAGDWDVIARLAASSPVPLMLDESLADAASIERLIELPSPSPLAHLKLAKLGGLDRLMAAGRRLREAGIGIMVGQMNEGGVSTLAAAHAAVALAAQRAELYGADGLADDPAGSLAYADGYLVLPPGPGIGLARHADTGTVLWEYNA